MPTYLLAFVISDLTSVTIGKNTVYSRAEQMSGAFFAAYFSEQFLNKLEETFEFSYKLSKMDSVAMPDHGSAMENW